MGFVICSFLITQSVNAEIRGDEAAVGEAKAMVKTMGGLEIWSQLKSVHFVHVWDIMSRPDTYIENEILDLTGPRSWVTMESEIYSRLRAYSPENKYWNIINGKFAYRSEEALQSALERAPFSIYRLAKAIAIGDQNYEVRLGDSPEFSGVKRLEFYGPDNLLHGWIVLNFRKEPIIWATTQYSYVFGPLKQFGNLRVPNWATTSNGLVRYEMVSLKGSNIAPDPALFTPPTEYLKN